MYDETVQTIARALTDDAAFLPANNELVLGDFTIRNIDKLIRWSVDYSREMNTQGLPQFATFVVTYTTVGAA